MSRACKAFGLVLTIALASFVFAPSSVVAGPPNPFAGTWYWGSPSDSWVEVSNGGRIIGKLYTDGFPRVMDVSGRINKDGSFAMEFSYHSGDGGVQGRTKPIVFEVLGWAELDSSGNVVGVFSSDEGITGTFLWIPQ